jgi:multiple sugar transport system permease protein
MIAQLKAKLQTAGSGIDTYRIKRKASAFLGTTLRWIVLLGFVHIFVFPLIFMVTTSFKTLSDLNNPIVRYIPRRPTLWGYQVAFEVMGYWQGLRSSVLISVAAALGQTLSGAMIAYGFARLRFPGRDALFALLLFTIVVPVQTIMVPQFILITRLGWNETLLPLILPAFLGFGVRGGVLLIVFRQFFKGLPYELEDAAYVDGAGPFRTFWRIMLPLAKPALLVVVLFSLVWTWNDAIMPWLTIRTVEMMTLTQRLQQFNNLRNLWAEYQSEENVWMAAVTMAVAPLLILYMFTQRYFTQSIDRTGLVE